MPTEPQSSSESADRRSFYRDRLAQLDRQIAAFELQSMRLSRWRGLAFFAAMFFGLAGRFGNTLPVVCYTIAAALFVGFIVLIIYHEAIIARQDVAQQRRKVNQLQLNRVHRDWTQIPELRIEIPTEHRPVSDDLDLFGHASLFQLICCAYTPIGKRTLRDWLTLSPETDEVVSRQKAVQQIAPLVDYREELAVQGRLIAASGAGPDAFIEWVEGPAWLAARSWLKWTTRGVTLAHIVLPVLVLAGVVPLSLGGGILAVTIVTSLILNVVFTGNVHEIFESVNSKHQDVERYQQLIQLIVDLPSENEFVETLKRRLGATPEAPLKRLRELRRIMKFANLRRSSLWGFFHVVLQIAFFVDYHTLSWLEVWQDRNRSQVRNWFIAIGQLESLASLATASHDHPDWAFPEFTNQERLEARQLGHPLIKDSECVRNDVQLGPRGSFLLVTGSNMSGKSTLLRSIGLNVMLGQAGGAVCAEAFTLPAVTVASSMRIQDSLEDGVSFFMAELKRLKEIVDQARASQTNDQRILLFLLDEILQGTNSVERHLAVEQVVGRLLKYGALGAVSTHDLELASSPSLKTHCQLVSFRESILGSGDDRRMTFDYVMRPGLAKTTNALKLLEMIGLK